MLQMLMYLTLDGTLSATFRHLAETATPTVCQDLLPSLNLRSIRSAFSTSTSPQRLSQRAYHLFGILWSMSIISRVTLYIAAECACHAHGPTRSAIARSLAFTFPPRPRKTYGMILLNGAGAFALNIVSFQANKSTSPLAMNIAGITKQVMAIILGIVVFNTPVTSLSAFGVSVTSLGIIWYARASFRFVGGEASQGSTLFLSASQSVSLVCLVVPAGDFCPCGASLPPSLTSGLCLSDCLSRFAIMVL